jgi:drug/metabolite transporter (DMT)-like permease
MPTSSRSSAPAILAALLSATIWGGWLPVTRLGVTTHLAPLDVAILRFMTAGLLLLPLLWLRRKSIPWGKWPYMVVVALAAGTPYLLVFAYGMRLTTTGQGAVLGPGVTGTISLLLGATLLKEVLQKRQWLGAALTLVGVLVIVGHEAMQNGVHLVGFALVLLASVSWATFTVTSRILAMDALSGAALIAVSNALVLIPIGLFGHRFAEIWALPNAVLWFQAGYQGVLTGAVALVSYVYAVQRLGAARAASFTPLAPVLSTILGIYWLGDPIDSAVLTGLILVVTGVLIANSNINANAVSSTPIMTSRTKANQA